MEVRASTLEEMREEIRRLDAALIEILAERLAVVRRIGELKRNQQVPVIDPAREAAVVAHVARLARARGLPEDGVRELFWRVMALSRREQNAD